MLPLQAGGLTTLQVNLGKRCNQACRHCHVDAGPQRTEEMTLDTVEQVIAVLRRYPFETLDLTGGAPEINAHFRYLAASATGLCDRVIDRSNLTIFFEPGQEDLGAFLANHGIEISASLPCYEQVNVDGQRGAGVFDNSILALQQLNRIGYGHPGSGLILNLVFNPTGPDLPPPQQSLEHEYKRRLRERFGIEFNRLYTITNMPISRFRHDLQRRGGLDAYMGLLERAFNPATLDRLMCRSLISVSHEGYLYDCDFNQMVDMKVTDTVPQHIRDFDAFVLEHRPIRTAAHCFGCTAGSGSSCGGTVVS